VENLFNSISQDVHLLAENFIKINKFSKNKRIKFTAITHNCNGFVPNLKTDMELVKYNNIVKKNKSDIIVIGL